MTRVTAAGLLNVVFYACLAIALGLNILTLLRYSQGRPLARKQRIRLAIVTVVIAVIGITCGAIGLWLS